MPMPRAAIIGKISLMASEDLALIRFMSPKPAQNDVNGQSGRPLGDRRPLAWMLTESSDRVADADNPADVAIFRDVPASRHCNGNTRQRKRAKRKMANLSRGGHVLEAAETIREKLNM
jgi:hypothetical protein